MGPTPVDALNGAAETWHLPILMYHRVADSGPEATARWRVAPDEFERQVAYLADAGFRTVRLEEWHRAAQLRQPLPGRAVVLTFDDAYEDFAIDAWPVLERHGLGALVFLVSEHVGGTAAWDSAYGEPAPLLDWDTARELAGRGVEFGSHCVTHTPLTRLSVDDIANELLRSRMLVTGAASTAGPAASREEDRVPSAVDCRTLLTRSRAPAARPVQLPARAQLTDEVANFVETAPNGQRYVFPTAAERARFQCGFQFAAAGRLVGAARLLQPFRYDVKQLGAANTPTAKRFVLLEERKSRSRDGVERYRRAWGLYVIAERTSVPVVAVEVPHQCKSTARCNEVGGDRRTHTM